MGQFEQVPIASPSASLVMKAAQKDLERDLAQRKLEWACVFCIVFMIAEFIGGYVAGSLAIMSDAAHLLSDVLGFLLSLFALYLSKFPATRVMPFGYKRAEVLGALGSILLIWLLTLGLVWAAIERIILLTRTPLPGEIIPQVNGKVMFCVALLGLCVNIALMKILGHGHSHGGHGHSHGSSNHGHSHGGSNPEHSHGESHAATEAHGHSHGACDHDHDHHHDHEDAHDDAAAHEHHDHDHDHDHAKGDDDDDASTSRESMTAIDVDDEPEPETHLTAASCGGHENLNVRAAYLHALGDFLQSLGVCIAGGLIWYNPSWQLCDPIVTLLFSVIVGATTIGICKTSLLVLMEGTSIELDLAGIEATIQSVATDYHDLRVWSVSTGAYALTVHVVNPSSTTVVATLQQRLLSLHGFECLSIQVETAADAERCPFNEKEAACMV
ncbi:hypothetical protein SDRG_12414 [Saprolegnia diclina VS20]|uniref:Cation efflux protein transmembrane domain-containing protein n=1 Tax=Saprolegnia diclina (strain VS20) TaxID=1156394 RepID=T0PWH4_SAPDV|nr:hypothetical protein SDRG_12414 [Saprolegnia diclina VS20]EQC29869.1 hypothetical protein SDRG_12414 [Saprolegnia diclina VS20]|eukprot:XP_008616708.1 hypothetical protein SDRG_12414 [Saprolegnia diclina VS20]